MDESTPGVPKQSVEVLLPSAGDYRARLATLQQVMAEARLDAVVLGSADNHLYFAGIAGLPTGRPIWMVVRQDRDPIVIAPRIEASEIRAMSWVGDLREWVEWRNAEAVATHWAAPLTSALDGVLAIGGDPRESPWH